MKNLINEMTVKFISRSANEAFARSVAAAFIAQLDPTMDELYDIKTAVSEAVTNSIVHGYKDSLGLISMQIKLYSPAAVEIVIRDKGCGIEDITQARQPMFTTGGTDRSGMGFTIMDSFMDSLSVTSSVGNGTIVRMKKTMALRMSAK